MSHISIYHSSSNNVEALAISNWPRDKGISRDVEVRVVKGFAGLSDMERVAWEALFEKQPYPTPFQSLFWNEAWWEVFGQSSRFITKDAMILVVSRGDEIIAFFPMFRATLSFLGIPLLRAFKPMGSDANLTEIKTGIVVEGREGDAFAAFLNYFKNVDRHWELVSMPAAPAVVDNLDALSIEHPETPKIEGFIIALDADWEAFHRGLKRNVKEDIRQTYNRLKRDGREPVFACLSDSAAIQNTLPEFYRLHSARAEKPDGAQHPDYFKCEDNRSFIGRLAGDAAKSGVRMFVLMDGDRVIAARLAFEIPGGTYLYYSGYDLEYEKYSIITRLVVEVLKRSISDGQQYVHMSFGRDRSKTRWSPQQVAYKQHLIIRNSLLGWLWGWLYRAILKRRKKRLDSQRPGPPDSHSQGAT